MLLDAQFDFRGMRAGIARHVIRWGVVTSSVAFFVQNNGADRLTGPVAQFARAHGYALEDRSWTPDFSADDCGIDWTAYKVVIPIGTSNWLASLLDSSLAKFVIQNDKALAASTWAASSSRGSVFSTHALNAGGEALPVSEITRRLQHGIALDLHVRPDEVDKAFSGRVFNWRDWEALLAEQNLSPDLMCWASPVRQLGDEWRCWIVAGKVVDVCQYHRAPGAVAVVRPADQVVAAASAIIAAGTPLPCVVMDVAYVDGACKIVEFNPIQSSGWYRADVAKILHALVSAFVRSWA